MERLYNYLTNNFKPNTPIFVSEVAPNGITPESVRQDLVRLCKANKIAKFSFGVYYIPLENELGKTKLSADDVIEKKYIRNGQDIYGFYSGARVLKVISV